jgi:hypothetical protein
MTQRPASASATSVYGDFWTSVYQAIDGRGPAIADSAGAARQAVDSGVGVRLMR